MFSSFVGVAWENVVVGLLGGFVVSAILYSGRRLSEWRLQRRFPIAGEFISRFEDIVDGGSVVTTAPATLTQRGRQIGGFTVQGGRRWRLDGELSASGYVHGVYEAEDPHDHGVGNFFLRVKSDRRLEGLWSGYDSMNEQISSGRYTFVPVARNVSVREFRDSDLVAVLRIADLELGDGYLDGRSVGDVHESDASFLLVAEVDCRVVGFSLCRVQDQATAAAAIRARTPRHLQLAATLGVVKTVAVLQRNQGQGVGSLLIAASVKELEARGAQVAYSVAWKHGDTVNIGGALERLGFTRFAEVPDYWHDDSIAAGYGCPSCGEPPCRCTAVMYSAVVEPSQSPGSR